MKFVVALFCFLPLSSAATHSLKYFYTATSGIADFAEFVMVGMVDNVEISFYDSFTMKSTPKQTWMEQLGQDYWDSETKLARMYHQNFRNDIKILEQRFNQTGGIHVFQKMYGCEWDDTGGIRGSEVFGYDAEDFLTFDLENMRWIAAVPQAAPSKAKWDRSEITQQRKEYFHGICVDWLKKYLQNGRTTLERKVHPEVSLLQKGNVSSGVVCHATGFYPEGVMITWKRDGVELDEDVYVGETLPNGDGTFQKRALLTVSPEERKKGQYTCEVAHNSGQPIVRIWTDLEKDGNLLCITIGCVVAVLVVICATVIMKKKRGYRKAHGPDCDSDSSNPTARRFI